MSSEINLKRLFVVSILTTITYAILLLIFKDHLLAESGSIVSHPELQRLFFDSEDIGVYFKESRWVIQDGRLYREIFSEYSFLANLIFGITRILSGNTANLAQQISWLSLSEFQWFAWYWMSASFFVLTLTIQLLRNMSGLKGWLVLLCPASIYFALMRFDIYPAFLITLMFFLLTKERLHWASIVLGLAIALKGFPLFFLPGFFTYLILTRGYKEAILSGLLVGFPFILTHSIVLLWAGWEGVLSPYQFHLIRSLNGESTYDLIIYIVRFMTGDDNFDLSQNPAILSRILQVFFALLPIALQPRNLVELARSYIIAIVGFVSTSLFHSPQFLLWYIPVIALSKSKTLIMLAVLLGWATYLFFPVGFDLAKRHEYTYGSTLILMTGLQIGILIVAIRKFRYKKRALLLT